MRVRTGSPEALVPENTVTMMVDESPGAVPAAPKNAGLLSFVVLPLSGLLNVTVGAAVSTDQDARAGDGSSLPEGPMARTSKTCRPSTSLA